MEKELKEMGGLAFLACRLDRNSANLHGCNRGKRLMCVCVCVTENYSLCVCICVCVCMDTRACACSLTLCF